MTSSDGTGYNIKGSIENCRIDMPGYVAPLRRRVVRCPRMKNALVSGLTNESLTPDAEHDIGRRHHQQHPHRHALTLRDSGEIR